MKQMYLMGYHLFRTILRSNPSGESCEQCKTENRLDCLTSLGFPPRRNISLSRVFVKRLPLLFLVLKISLGAALPATIYALATGWTATRHLFSSSACRRHR